MAGSIRVLWPWPAGVDSTAIEAPSGDWVVALALALVAFGVVFVVARYAQGLEAAEERAAARAVAPAEGADRAEEADRAGEAAT
jgi:putative membrane protein